MANKIRVLLAKSILDAHDRGIRYLIQLIRDAGMEVIFTRYASVDEVIKQAIEEDVQVVGLAFYGSGLMHDSKRLLQLKKENNIDDLIYLVGGTISEAEREKLLEMGVDRVFQPNIGVPDDIVTFIQERVGV